MASQSSRSYKWAVYVRVCCMITNCDSRQHACSQKGEVGHLAGRRGGPKLPEQHRLAGPLASCLPCQRAAALGAAEHEASGVRCAGLDRYSVSPAIAIFRHAGLQRVAPNPLWRVR